MLMRSSGANASVSANQQNRPGATLSICGRVLDPFGGAGTTALVAIELGLQATSIDLNPAYTKEARARIAARKLNDGSERRRTWSWCAGHP